MRSRHFFLSFAFSILIVGLSMAAIAGRSRGLHPHSIQPAARPLPAATPPMGWNSWDSYGSTIDEAHFRANAAWMARHLKPFGWQYVVVDMGWYVANPNAAGDNRDAQFSLDKFGRFIPALDRFPSAADAAGFKPLADYVHSLGLKFGVHILRGIPRAAVDRNLPIGGSSFHAADAADTSDTCPWNSYTFGVDPSKPAGQAYYDSIARLYASWGVDFVKADCIASRPYKGDEIRMLSLALQKTGRPIVLSLSPGEAPIEKIGELREYAQLWRISDDIWDLWHSHTDFPQGVGDQFARAAQWSSLTEPGHWPDADMLPIGHLGPAPGWGQPRETRLTHDEQRTLLTLWSIFRSPLMMGGDLPSTGDWTLSLLTDPEVIAVDQHSIGNHPAISNGAEAVWLARPPSGPGNYVAIFNLSSQSKTTHLNWSELGLPATKHQVRDLWQRKDLGAAGSLSVTLSPHASVLYLLSPVSRSPS